MESEVISNLQENDFQLTKFYKFHDPIEKVYEAYTNIELLSKILSKYIKIDKILRTTSLHDEGNEITIDLISKYKITFKVCDVTESKDYYSLTLKTVFYPTTFCFFEIKIQLFWDSIEEVCVFQGSINFEPSPFRETLLNNIKKEEFFPNKQIEEYLIQTVKNLEETESISINENINKVWEFITELESIKYFFPLGNELLIQLENKIIIKIFDPKTKNEVILLKKEKKEEDEKVKINIKKIDTGNTKNSLDKILQIIDFGFDKKFEDFDKQINILSNKLIKQTESINLVSNEEEEEETILNQEAFLPITSYRNYLKPNYIDFKKLYRNDIGNNEFNLLIFYKTNFEYIVKNYFPHFLLSSNDSLIQKNLQKVRENFYNNYKIKLLLIEEENVINDLCENLISKIYNNDNLITEEEYNSFWKYFIKEKKDLKPNFIFHIVPYYEKSELNPFRLLDENDDFNINPCYLSEFIASNDNIYKNIVFMPFASNSDPTFFSFIPNCQTLKDNVLVFPSLDCMYSFLKKPLDYYISDSNGILNLDLYKISIGDDKKSEKVFWKNIEIISTETYNVNCKLTLFFVDNLGLEFKDKNRIEIMLNGSFILKIYNLFFKKNVPFNYNMSSNNGWLELFLKENYDKKEINKYCNYSSFIKNSVEGKYYEEFNVPQMDLETIFKNYKVKKIILEGWKNDIQIKYDDNIIYDCSKFISNEKKDIIISFYERNHEKVTIPVATFISL